jgi:hypothetical protein
MVTKLAEVEPRSSGDTVLTNPDTGEDFFRPEQVRDVLILTSSLDTYAEVTIEATHSNDTEFANPLTIEQGLPLLPGRTREAAYTGSNERIKLTVTVPNAPTSGSLTVWKEKDNTPLRLNSTRLRRFKELNEGRAYATDVQSELASGGTLTVGVRNPSDSPVNIFVEQFGISTGGDALVTTEIDHGSYTDGTSLSVINKKPELQVERPLNGSVTQNPTTSSPQETITGFLPGGSGGGGASPGARSEGTAYELSAGQDITPTIENDSGATNRYGFSIDLLETVVR